MQSLRNIHGIFLDLGGTLLYPPSGSFSFSALAKQYFTPGKLSKLPEERIRHAIEQARQALYAHLPVLTIEDEHPIFLAYYTALSEELGLGLSPAQLAAITDDKVYNKTDNSRLFDDTKQTLEALSGKYRLGIISDTWPSVVPLLEHLDILKYFDCATYSYELGTLKPDPKMYQDALTKMGLPAQETLFVDDNPKNLAGAAALGIHPVLICAAPWSPSLDKTFSIDVLQTGGQNAPARESLLSGEPPRIEKISELLNLLD